MTQYWWKDALDRDDKWQGLELNVLERHSAKPIMEMVSGHHGRMSLLLGNQPLFWSSMLKDHSGAWLIFNAEHQSQGPLLPPVTSMDVEAASRAAEGQSAAWWCRYFAQALMIPQPSLLTPRKWLLRPMTFTPPSIASPQGSPGKKETWQFKVPSHSSQFGLDWRLSGEDFPNLLCPDRVALVDWWWSGHLLLGRYNIRADDGRLKWWRKKSREGTLPPVLVWYIAGLSSFVIIDGHYRLQAAIEEGIPPGFVVLSEFAEGEYKVDEEQRSRTEKAMLVQQKRNPAFKLDSMNHTLIGLYDTRYQYSTTHSRAVLGEGDEWAKEVSDYLHKHHLEAYLSRILNRESDEGNID